MQRTRIAGLTKNVAKLEQHLSEAEHELIRKQRAWDEQVSKPLPSVAVIPGFEGFLSPSGLQVVVTPPRVSSQEPMRLYDLTTLQYRELPLIGDDPTMSPGVSPMIAMCSVANVEGQREILLLDLANDHVRSLGRVVIRVGLETAPNYFSEV